MSVRKVLLRITFRFLTRRNKLFAPIVLLGWVTSFLRWLSKREKKSNRLIEDIEVGGNISISHLERSADPETDE
jgi:hypothetical protein